MTYQVRPICDRDWDSIVWIEAATYADTGLSEERAVLESRARAAPATSFVVEAGGRVAGYLLALPYPRFCYPALGRAEQCAFVSSNLHLHDLVIAAGFRGSGLAKRLLRQLTGAAAALAYERISLVAVGGSDPFWSAQGYHSHPEVALPSGYGAGAVYMSRAISNGREADPHVPCSP
ncbi:MAG TPA: GNAT family N-acetyltransferase [Micromonosporaceae bacterium]|nr:GNAT family N-acetyltransferase [Micromonosporaceae bacterium]